MADLTPKLKPGWHSLEILAWAALYSTFLAVLFGYNAASPDYRAIFIDKTATYPPADRSTAYVPGTVIAGDLESGYFRGGWWPGRDGRIFSRAATSVIELTPTSEIGAGSRLRGKLSALLGVGLREQRISITVDDTEIGVIEIKGGDVDFDFELSTSAKAGEPLRIAFTIPRISSPLLAHINHDTRMIGISLFEISVVPKP